MMTDLEIREEIIKTAREFLAKGLVQGTGGNFSMRCRDGFIITPSGMDYRLLVPDDLPKLSLEGIVIEGKRTPSIERGLHRAVYAARGDVMAVVHTHSICATAVASMRRPIPTLTDNQAVYFGGEIPISEYAPIGTPELARNSVAALGSGAGVLMANHGALCVGSSLAEAVMRSELLEVFAKIYLLVESCGGGVPLTAEEAEREAADVGSRYGQRC